MYLDSSFDAIRNQLTVIVDMSAKPPSKPINSNINIRNQKTGQA